MSDCGVGADSQDAVGITNLTDGVGHSSAAECCGQTGHSGGVSEAGTVVNVVGAQHGSAKFLDNIVIFVSALG